MVAVTNPPITANAIGERKEAPSPNPKHIGNRAKIVVSPVMIIGRIRCWAAAIIASVSSIPCSFN